MTLHFTKMHGCGNDYIYVDGFKEDLKNPSLAAQKLSPRHFAVGADGLILICPSKIADAKMRMFNADGSEGKMCGNGIRCVAKFVYDNGICRKNPLLIETLSGLKTVHLTISGGVVTKAAVAMGMPEFAPSKIPVTVKTDDPIINQNVTLGGKTHTITCVSMGNPHCVIFVPQDFPLWEFDIKAAGAPIENDPYFPEGVNVEFVKPISSSQLEMRVWERGSGETFACGTGACASVAAACKNGICSMDTPVTVKLRGGDLSICYRKDGIEMTGEAVTAFCGSAEV